jgi:hypothetical protein
MRVAGLAGLLGRRARAAFGVCMLTAVTGCGCELVGCVTGLLVTVENAPAGGYTAFARAGEGERAREVRVTCPDGRGCGARVLLEGLDAGPVDLTISTANETRYFRLNPTFVKQQPNGAKCGPTCYYAEDSVSWR